MTAADPYRYKYYLLGDSVPVKLFLAADTGLKAGAQIPDGARGQLRFAHDYMSRLEQSPEVTEIDEETFNNKCAELYAKKNGNRFPGGLTHS